MASLCLPLGGSFALRTLAQVSVHVRNLDRAAAFYREVLRLRQIHFETGSMAFFDAGGVRLLLSVPERPEFDHPSSILYFQVQDIRAAYQALVERGVRFTAAPLLTARLTASELWMAFFRDSEGNLLALMSEQLPAQQAAAPPGPDPQAS